MDNRYLFRGKCVNSRKWFFGSLIMRDDGKHFIAEKCMRSLKKPHGHFLTGYDAVDPATVGQCTGLKDKNGTLIFEGDIVTISNDDVLDDFTAQIYWDNGWCVDYEDIEVPLYISKIAEGAAIEIIGHVHDHPELIREDLVFT